MRCIYLLLFIFLLSSCGLYKSKGRTDFEKDFRDPNSKTYNTGTGQVDYNTPWSSSRYGLQNAIIKDSNPNSELTQPTAQPIEESVCWLQSLEDPLHKIQKNQILKIKLIEENLIEVCSETIF